VRAGLEHARLEARAGDLEGALAAAEAAKLAAETIEYPPVRAEAEARLGVVLATLDRSEEAQPLLEHAMQTALEHRQSHLAARAAIELTGVLVGRGGRALESQWLAKAALGLAEGEGTDVVLVADAMLAVGNVFADRDLELEAEPYYRGAVERLERSLGPDHPDLVGPLLSWASLLKIAKREGEAVDVCRRALELSEEAFGPDHPQTASALEELAGLQLAAHRFEESEHLADRALSIYEAAFGPTHHTIRGALSRRAGALAYQGRHAEAIAGLEEAMRRLGDVPPDHPSRASLLHNIALVNSMRGEHERAAELFGRANDIRRRHGIRPDLAAGVGALGQELVQLGRLDEAEAAFREAWQLSVAIHADDGLASGMALIQIGKIELQRRDTTKALEQFEAAWAVERDGPDDLVKVEAALELGDALWKHGKDKARARGLVETARDTLLRDGRAKGEPMHERIERWLTEHPLGARPAG
jgi:tetratricopeptide (TPR) repeat protein